MEEYPKPTRMIRLNFPEYDFQFSDRQGKLLIFDPVRKKYVAFTPEEWVRQHVIRFLVSQKKVPAMLIKVECELQLYKTRKRFDLAVFDRNGNALLLVECKAPSVNLSQEVLDQAARYNLAMKVRFLMLTNGMQHLYCEADNGRLKVIVDLPDYQDLR